MIVYRGLGVGRGAQVGGDAGIASQAHDGDDQIAQLAMMRATATGPGSGLRRGPCRGALVLSVLGDTGGCGLRAVPTGCWIASRREFDS